MAEQIKHYTPREEKLSAYSHLTGVFLVFAGIYPLWKCAAAVHTAAFTAGVIFYWISLLAMFGASSFYHFCKDEKSKLAARKFDHLAIYLLITGTYAPLITGAVKTFSGFVVLAVLILLTLLGIVNKLLFANKFHFLEVIIYIVMGWACVFIARDLIAGMSRTGLMLLLAGGITYTSGVIFYAIRKEFFHAAWHIFVLAGAILHFLSILTIGKF
ncbi:MAG: hemolysin III [Lentisphaerae bacterium]|nr:hemolysin III [Lentisphaerota bacterium]